MKTRAQISGWLRQMNGEKGSVLIITYFVLTVLAGLGAAFFAVTNHEAVLSDRQYQRTLAFYVAEAGAEAGINELRLDLVGQAEPSWCDGYIHDTPVTCQEDSFVALIPETTFERGSYVVNVKNDLFKGDDVWLQSIGTVDGITETIEVYVRKINLSPWEYAIFAGSGATGTMINGNVDIRGSVIILGDGLADGDLAFNAGGTANIVGNNYASLDAALAAKVPALDQVEYNGEMVETLNATLRVKKGIVSLDGDATVGQPDVAGNAYKETVDGVFVNDGYAGNQGSDNVFSDNPSSTGYDLGDAVTMPSLSDPFTDSATGTDYATYKDYLKANAYVVTAAEAAQLANIEVGTVLPHIGDAKGSIEMDLNGNMTINGIVYIDNGGDLSAAKGDPIKYTGTGSIYVDGDVSIGTDLYTDGNISFPNNIMGIMTPNTITIGTTAQLDVMGLFFGETQITINKQTNVMGTIVSNYFDMGGQVPGIYQVPETANNLPPGMIAGNTYWYAVAAWMRSSS